SKLADDIVQAVDIRETVAAPETVLNVFRGMKDKLTPQQALEHTRALFTGDVIRSAYVTPAAGEASAAGVRTALAEPVTADGGSRLAAKSISFDELPAIGPPGTVVADQPIGVLDIEQVSLSNGVR